MYSRTYRIIHVGNFPKKNARKGCKEITFEIPPGNLTAIIIYPGLPERNLSQIKLKNAAITNKVICYYEQNLKMSNT